MAPHAQIPAFRGRPHVLVAYKAGSVRIRSSILVVDAETFGMAGRLYIASVAHRRKHSGDGFGVANLAVRHPELGRNTLGRIVAGDAIHHFWQSQIGEAGAPGNGVVTGSAVEVEL